MRAVGESIDVRGETSGGRGLYSGDMVVDSDLAIAVSSARRRCILLGGTDLLRRSLYRILDQVHQVWRPQFSQRLERFCPCLDRCVQLFLKELRHRWYGDNHCTTVLRLPKINVSGRGRGFKSGKWWLFLSRKCDLPVRKGCCSCLSKRVNPESLSGMSRCASQASSITKQLSKPNSSCPHARRTEESQACGVEGTAMRSVPSSFPP
jgi:hypothetical protein